LLELTEDARRKSQRLHIIMKEMWQCRFRAADLWFLSATADKGWEYRFNHKIAIIALNTALSEAFYLKSTTLKHMFIHFHQIVDPSA
jgi:hypothetical protein